jgi:hypothetical protein
VDRFVVRQNASDAIVSLAVRANGVGRRFIHRTSRVRLPADGDGSSSFVPARDAAPADLKNDARPPRETRGAAR